MLKKNKIVCLFILSVLIFSSCGILHKKAKQGNLSEKVQLEVTTSFINGVREKILGNYEKAITYFLESLKNNPNHAASMYELSEIYFLQKKDKDALSYIEKAAKTDPENKWYLTSYAETLIANKDYKSASAVYKTLSEKFPFEVDNYFNWAMCYIYLGRYAEAIDVYNKIEDVYGVTEEICLQKQKIYVQINKFSKAVEEIQKLIDLNPQEPIYYNYLADLYLENKMYDKAFATYQKILEIDPENGAVNLSLADYYRTKKEYEKSFESLKKAFASPSLEVDVKIKILLSYYSLTEKSNDLKSQADTLMQILTVNEPNEPKVFAMYADFLYRDNKLKEAETQLIKVLSLDSSKYAVWEQLLFIESDLNNTDELEKNSKAAIELFPEQAMLYLFNGMANYLGKNYDEAIISLNKGIALVVYNNSLLTQFLSYLGDSYYFNKNYTEAYATYDKVLSIDSKNQYVLNNYSYYLALAGTDLDKAQKMAKKLVELNPNSASYIDTYGWVLYKSGNFSDAESQISTALTKGGDKNAIILEHYGDVQYKLKNTVKAQEYWKKAQDAGKGSELLDKKVTEGILFE